MRFTCIALHLFVSSLHRDCPEECKEAVASLIYAAARFADLPELRDLRAMFTEKYGNSLESFTSKEVNMCALFLLIYDIHSFTPRSKYYYFGLES